MAVTPAPYAWFVLLYPSLLLFKINYIAATDRFVLGEIFTPQRAITSGDGDFVFGFFNLTDDSSGRLNPNLRWYVGIWYANGASFTVIWVANRDNPVSAELISSAFITITNESTLQLVSNGSSMWSTKPAPKRAAAAVIQDGNLMLVAAENSSEVVWQSFDEPGNTWLPTMKLGTNQSLCAWKSLSNPATGPFCLHMDAHGTFLLTWNRSISYWDSGVWDGQKYSKSPEIWQQNLYRYRYVDTGSYKYFVYWIPDESPKNFLCRTWMHPSGQLQASVISKSSSSASDDDKDQQWSLVWTAPANPCDVYAFCGAFSSCNTANAGTCSCLVAHHPRYQSAWDTHDWSAGCIRNTPFACNTTGDDFVQIQDRSLPSRGVAHGRRLISYNSCRHACLANCSCTAFAMATNGSSTCIHWFGDLLNIRHDDALTHNVSLFLRLNTKDVPRPSPKSNSNSKTHNKAGIYSGVVAAGLLVIAGVCVLLRRKANKRNFSGGESTCLKVFSYKQLREATGDFSHCIGGGGFGSVFKGTLPGTGTDVAVKKLEGGRQGEKEFRTEVATVGQVQHVNVVQLLGFCCERRHRMLVYEFMPNGSLASQLFRAGPGLDWKTRFQVAVGTARALEYLHEQCRHRIIHCDIKPENILLDAQFHAKVADFGLAKMMGRDFSKALTSMRGTRGYLAPEWLSGQPITAMADVYSFGMTLLEMVTGRRNAGRGGGGSNSFFVARAASEISAGKAMVVRDPRLAGDASMDEEQMTRLACMALWCVQDDADARPSMSDVVKVLQGLAQPPEVPPPVPPLLMQASLVHGDDNGSPPSVVFFWDHESYAQHKNDEEQEDFVHHD